MFKKDKSLKVSAPEQRAVHGVAIKKLPIGKYIEVLRTAEDLPSLLFGQAFPEVSNFGELAGRLVNLDRDALLKTIGRLLITVPTEACTLISNLFDIPLERMLDSECDDPLSLNELAEVLIAFAEANDYSNFFMNVQKLAKSMKPATAQTGCKNGSQ